MKVLFQNREHHWWQGGDKVQLDKTMQVLREHGIECDYTSNPYVDLKEYDIVHLFHLSYQWSYAHLLNAKLQKKPCVLTPIATGFDQLFPQYQQEILDYVSAVFCISNGEKEFIASKYDVAEEKLLVVPNGIDKKFFVSGNKQYALHVGRVEPEKNQLYSMRACADLKIPLKIIGEMRDIEYATRCNNVEGEFQHINHISQDNLIDYYKHCKVLILPSLSEVAPLCVMEAGAAGANIVLTKYSKAFTEYPNVWVCDPFSWRSVKRAVKRAWKAENNNELVQILKTYSWDTVAVTMKGVYESIVH